MQISTYHSSMRQLSSPRINIPETTPYLSSSPDSIELLETLAKNELSAATLIRCSANERTKLALQHWRLLEQLTWSEKADRTIQMHPLFERHFRGQGGSLMEGSLYGDPGDHRWTDPLSQPLIHQLIHPQLPYLDGNRISVETADSSANYLVSQAPLPQQFLAFWQKLIWDETVSVILHLTAFNQNRIPKSDCYWQSGTYGLLNILSGSPTQLLAKSPNESDQRFLIYPITITHGTTGDKRSLTLIHTPDWPDKQALSAPGMQQLTALVDRVKTNHNLLIHCSAGRGRTGQTLATFICNQTLRQQAEKPISEQLINPLKIVYDLRTIRPGLMENKAQYIEIYHTIRSQYKE